jgi:hypothetical protein
MEHKCRTTRRSSGFKYQPRSTPQEIEQRAQLRAARKQEQQRRLEQERLLAIEHATQIIRTSLSQNESAMIEAALAEIRIRKRLKLGRLTVKDLMIRQRCQQAYRLDEQNKRPTAADSYFIQCLTNMIVSRQIKAGKVIDRKLQDRLMRYLLDGTRDDGKKPRIRIVEHDDTAARGQQGAR